MKKISGVFVLGLAAMTLLSCGPQGFDTSSDIKLYTRDTDSGTRDGFFTKIGLEDAKADNAPLKTGIVTVDSNGSMMNSVGNDMYGIGYISLSTLSESDAIKGLSYNGVEPTEANVLNETYGLTRNFNYITRKPGDYSSIDVEAVVNAFIDYTFSFEGYTIMKGEHGIVEIPSDVKHWSEIASEHAIMQRTDLNLTINVGGSTSVSGMAQALTTAFSSLFQSGSTVRFNHNHTGSGDAYKNTQGGEGLDIGYLSRELESSEPAMEGTSGYMCTDAIVTIVNSENPLDNITDTQLVDMYGLNGETVTWSQLITE